MATQKSENKSGNATMIGQAVTVQWTFPHMEALEDVTLVDLNQWGAVTEGEWRGSLYRSLIPYSSIRSLDARIRLADEKPAKGEKGEATK